MMLNTCSQLICLVGFSILLSPIAHVFAETQVLEIARHSEPQGIAHRSCTVKISGNGDEKVTVPIDILERVLRIQVKSSEGLIRNRHVWEFSISYTDPHLGKQDRRISTRSPAGVGVIQDASNSKYIYCCEGWLIRILEWNKASVTEGEALPNDPEKFLIEDDDFELEIPNKDRIAFSGPWANVINGKIRSFAISRKGTALIDLWADPDLAFDHKEHSIIYEIARDQPEPVSRHTASFEEALKKVNSEERQ